MSPERIRFSGGALLVALLLAPARAHATCMELPTFSCEVVPTFGDCTSPESNQWPPGVPFTYRIGCQAEQPALRDLEVLPQGTVLGASDTPLRKCEQWDLWVLEAPLPAPPEGGVLTLQARGATKPIALQLQLVAGAEHAPRATRTPRKDFSCAVAPPHDESARDVVLPPAASGCGACALATANAGKSWGALGTFALAGLALSLRAYARAARAAC